MPQLNFTITSVVEAEYRCIAEGYQDPYFVLAPNVLAFCIEIAKYLAGGYVIGRGSAMTGYRPHQEIGLFNVLPESIPFEPKVAVCIAPHHYFCEISDVPTHRQLLELKRLTNSPTLSSVINRVAYWLSYFTYWRYYCYEMAALHSLRKEIRVLRTPFFEKFSKTVWL